MGFLSSVIVLLCSCGIALSSYAIYIVQTKNQDNNFKPACDLDETISCSSVLLSKYSRGLGLVGQVLGEDHVLNLPNTYVGLIFFLLMMVLAFSSSFFFTTLAMLGSLISSMASAYLMYLLAYVLKTICLVCVPVNFINVLLFILNTVKWSRMVQATNKRLKTD